MPAPRQRTRLRIWLESLPDWQQGRKIGVRRGGFSRRLLMQHRAVAPARFGTLAAPKRPVCRNVQFAEQGAANLGGAVAVCYGFEFTQWFENGLTTSAFHQFSCARN